MVDIENKVNSIKSDKKNVRIISIIYIIFIFFFSALILFVSKLFIFILLLLFIAGFLFYYIKHRNQERRYNDLISDYNHLDIHFKENIVRKNDTSVYEEKYNALIKLFESSREMLSTINNQIHEFVNLKKTNLETITDDQKNLIHKNENIIEEIQNKNKTFFTENNIVKELMKNISEKVDSEIGFSRNTLNRLKNLFNIITDIIKASEILYNNSEFLVSIMQTIENISNKIHVLSINASVIAARAGEAGKSFMVVAKEVRNLSDNVKQSVEEMKNNSEKLKTSIDEVTDNIQEIETETKTTYEDMENLLMRFEGLNLSINIIDKKIIANMEIIKGFESLIYENKDNNNKFIMLLDSIDMDGLAGALQLIDQAKGQFSLFHESDSENKNLQ